MKNNSTRNKIVKMFKSTEENTNNLDLNSNTNKKIYNPYSNSYSSFVLYDSGWVYYEPSVGGMSG